MRSASVKEIEYLSAIAGNSSKDASFVNEMSRRLDALRRFDQFCCMEDRQMIRSTVQAGRTRKEG
jgi:hypothetical protein